MSSRPPFVDPKTGITYDASKPNFEGWLTKQSEWLKDWRKRYAFPTFKCCFIILIFYLDVDILFSKALNCSLLKMHNLLPTV